jgi:hypothetical protein
MSDNIKPDCNLHALRQIILDSFPSYPLHGLVMAVSHDPSVYEVDADNLDKVLAGKEWRELEAEYLDANPDEYVLMNDSAVAAFLGAWLWRAADDLRGENRVRDSLIFHLASFGGSRVQNYGLWANGFRSLNQQQRNAISSLLEFVITLSDTGKEDALKALSSVKENPFMGA